ncbi:MBL fold metallo-hydrolase [Haloparvum sedimenti]|uniref:MBL fold metallo-hydrolase n=1 Tax=Haloparvum sedimenti TaxID=1678448 RepID=UPI00071E94C8|nr:MBL fold metallo-hydrolase [Haloparvum sedimenti]
MELEFLGGAREVGRSAVLVDDRLLLDFGTLAAEPPQYPVRTPEPEAVVVSHGHLDHVGSVPALLSGRRRPAIHWTPPTGELARTLARDTLKLRGNSPTCPFTAEHVRRLGEVEHRHGYREPFPVCGGIADGGYEVTLYDAGHIPGSAHVLVDDGETRLLYAGDFHTDDQRLLAGTTARPNADAVVCESTYADVDHEPRATVEDRFVDRVETTLWEGGTVVAPAFAIGRTQELLLVCAAHDLPCYVDGMGTDVARMLKNHPDFVRDPDALRRAIAHARFVDGRDGQRERIAEQPAVIVTTSGMLSGGPAMTYVPAVRANPVNAVTMTGYQVEGTPGRSLLESGSAEIDGRVMQVSAGVEAYDFSAHADRGGLRKFLDPYRGAEVLVVHGDDAPGFAERLSTDGHDASAPELGATVTV